MQIKGFKVNIPEQLRKVWRLYYKRTYRLMAFITCSILMVLSFPSTNHYSFEYELKRPWRYENVIAPYDFPIYKTDAEIQQERDSIMKTMLPFYVRDTITTTQIKVSVGTLLGSAMNKIRHAAPQNISQDSLRDIIRKSLITRLKETYDRGVVDVTANEDNTDFLKGEIIILRGNLMEPNTFDDVFTLRDAYSHISNGIVADLRHATTIDQRSARHLVEQIPLDAILVPNLHYDEAKTNQGLNAKLDAIPVLCGKVLSGERIIGMGDIVDKPTARILESLKRHSETLRNFQGKETYVFVGQLIIVGGLLFTIYLFLYYFRKDYFRTLHVINLILLLITFMVCTTGRLADNGANISYIVPYVVLPVMIRLFTDSRLAIYANTVTILIISFFAYNSQLFIFLHIPAGLVACICLYHLNRRSQVLRTTIYMLLFYSVMYTGYMMWQQTEFAPDPVVYIHFAISSALILMVYPLLYIAEKMFGFVSDVTLLEMSDVNNKLLRELSEKCPGTFQHSLQVGNLGQEVAMRLGANPMLVRVGAMYHDIGKLVNPMYFTENQVGGINPHNELPYEKSAQLIIRHVQDGIELARQNNLPSAIRDIIACHHGTSLVRYFYLSWCNEHPTEDPDMSIFTYGGPIPQTKEQAIIMMADAVEAGSKSLKQYTDEDIEAIVDKVVDIQVNAHQFIKAPITFADIEEAKSVFKEKLRSIYHTRIQYPEKKV